MVAQPWTLLCSLLLSFLAWTTDGFTHQLQVVSKNAIRMASSTEIASNDSSPTGDNGMLKISVALTREQGKNNKLQKALDEHQGIEMMPMSLNAMEMPCIEHAPGDDQSTLVDILSTDKIQEYDYVVITSPEAARVLAASIQESTADRLGDDVQVAAVGKATAKTLEKLGLSVDFVPSQATGETLASELPPIGDNNNNDGPTRILYPASAKAKNDIQEGLMARNTNDTVIFEFTRLNTYDTVSATFNDEQLSLIDDIDVVCFGSPSSVTAWLDNVDRARGFTELSDEEKRMMGPDGNGNVLAACIGTTSARACLESGRWHAADIYYPKVDPGVENWAWSTAQAVGDVVERKFWEESYAD
ncbi:Uroporphyrinogen-III Synthase [Seminavis robusta]|uniref:Uroporphyrinogen-III synthase n=1 Tax=Seminavis robusta TaxID=568900 RepID=A0A9N8HHM5_9STRA|nr:Uroporphyrinogen-III Synthase [Seminavis robusta]|eukprot:Sro570_g168570.1 Uroporphyrinogen-III Synthase (359) ;mRNA; r:48384-49460